MPLDREGEQAMRLLLVGTTVLFLASCSEQPHRYYARVAEAAAAGEDVRGWLPAWLPRSATEVHLQSDLDTNDWWIRANLSSAAADSLRSLLSRVPAERVLVRQPRSGSKWWFEGLIEQQAADDGALHAELFRGRGAPVESTIVVAFDRTSPAVFVWTRATR